MERPTCSSCKHFFPVHENDDATKKLLGGQCRIRAPIVGFVMVPKVRRDLQSAQDAMVPVIERCSAWPHVTPDVWCGEWQQVEAA